MEADRLSARIEGVQVLRALAAVMVVVHHARGSVPGSEAFWPDFGAAGVDIFFVISGFVMSYTTRHFGAVRSQSAHVAYAGDFLRRRLARVIPMYWLALLWTSRRDLTLGHISTDLWMDFAFIPHPNAIYTSELWPTVSQGWTLNYEMFFYGLFALSLLCGVWRTVLLIGSLLLLVGLGWIFNVAGGPIGSPDATTALHVFGRFYTAEVLLEFGYGVLLQRLAFGSERTKWPRAVYLGLALAGFALLAVYGSEFEQRGVRNGLPALLIVWASIHAFAGVRLRALERLGDASYAIYLFHWASFGAVKPVASWLSVQGYQGMLWVNALMALHILVALVSGLFIHSWIEKPFLSFAQAVLRIRPAVRPSSATT